jgi:hypothetical protein
MFSNLKLEALRDDRKGPLFRTVGRGTDERTRTPLLQVNAHGMIGWRAAMGGIATKTGNTQFG